jgi:microcystin-dependent protein
VGRLAWITPPSLPSAVICRRLIIPNDPFFVAAVNGALLPLIDPQNWEQVNAPITPEEAAAAAAVMYYDYLDTPVWCMIGAIVAVCAAEAPEGTLLCDGSVYSRADYPRLYEALPAALRLDSETFQVPDLRDRFVLAAGVRQPLETGGSETVTLTVEQLPAHTHTAEPHAHTAEPHAHTAEPHTHTDAGHTHGEGIAAPSVAGVGVDAPVPSAVPSVGVTAPASATILPEVVTVLPSSVTINETVVTLSQTGGGEPHDNLPPFVVLSYVIIAR